MKSITTKWLITILGVMIIGLSLLEFASYRVITNHYWLYTETTLLHRAASYAKILSHDFNKETLLHVSGMESETSSGMYIFNAKGDFLTSSGLAKKRGLFREAKNWVLQTSKHNIKINQQGIVMAKKTIVQGEKNLGTVLILTELTWLDSTLRSLQLMLLLASIGALLVAMGLSLLLSRRIVRPILDIRQTAEQLAKGDYLARVNVSGEDELASLGMQMNRLAESLLYYRSSRREFLSHVAHEIRTPLTYVKGYVSFMQKPNLSKERSNHLIRVIQEQSNRYTDPIKPQTDAKL